MSTRFGDFGTSLGTVGGFLSQRVWCSVPGVRCPVGTARFPVFGRVASPYEVNSLQKFSAVRSSQLLLVAAALLCAQPLLSQRTGDSVPPSSHSSPYRPGIDVLDYELRVSLPDAGNIIDGLATLTVRRFAAVDTLVLDFVRLNVRSMQVNDTVLRRRARSILPESGCR